MIANFVRLEGLLGHRPRTGDLLKLLGDLELLLVLELDSRGDGGHLHRLIGRKELLGDGSGAPGAPNSLSLPNAGSAAFPIF